MVMTKPISDESELEPRSLEDFISIKQAVEESGYTEQYMRRLARANKIHAIKFGHFWMVNVESLKAYMVKADKSPDKRFGPRGPQA